MTSKATPSQTPSIAPLQQTTPTAGAMLRQAREDLGLSIADVAAVTRIPRNMLEHLERDRFDEYAACVFTRGHIMNFAREVRLDPERVLSAYDRQSGQRRPSQEFEPPVTKPTRQRRIPSLTTSARAKAAARQTSRHATTSAHSKQSPLHKLLETVRPVHMVTVLLLLCALFASAFFLNGSSATAQNTATFKSPSEDAWSLEKDADQARWFLEQPAAASPAKKSSN